MSSVISLARRLERLETVRKVSDVTAMSDAALRQNMAQTLEALGGRDAALAPMRGYPGVHPDAIKIVEEWPAWPL